MLIGIFLIFIATFISIECQPGSRVTLETLDLDMDFDAILSTCICDVSFKTIDKDQKGKIEIQGERNSLFHFRIGFESFDENVRLLNFFAVGLNSSKVHVRIYLKNTLQRYVHVGHGDISTFGLQTSVIMADKFTFDHFGTGYVDLKFKVPYFEANLHGSGVYRFEGIVTNEAIYRTSGKTYLDAVKLRTKNIQVFSRDTSEVFVEAQHQITGKAADYSKILYRLTMGVVNPKKLYQNDDSCITQIE